jgi:hypothetical protein
MDLTEAIWSHKKADGSEAVCNPGDVHPQKIMVSGSTAAPSFTSGSKSVKKCKSNRKLGNLMYLE